MCSLTLTGTNVMLQALTGQPDNNKDVRVNVRVFLP